MGRKDDRMVGGLCGYAKSMYEARVEDKKRRRTQSEPAGAGGRQQGYGKLHKPPQVRPNVRPPPEKPRNRLRKSATHHTLHPAAPGVFILEFEPYPNSSQPGKVLGAYSTFDAVTLGALEHGAYTFSREGLLDGSEYLSSTGRIKIVRTTVQLNGTRAVVPERSRNVDGEHVRLDIPHPESQTAISEEPANTNSVFLAIREGPHSASWIGAFVDKSLAWGACLKDRAMCAASYTISEEGRSIALGNMPQLTAKLEGGSANGRYTWMVQAHVINAST
ncbi:hypothetical protein FB567DRAFT_119122 [Paraphoma chrysanthemicola]|uniref:Uncharacterized protein n=1 Tax=Paraphoma chrysanthemicola TaxID=798071 RepID=A0A8K0R0R8_9PLEO|nr:hypothetical protein FB567DRAFT_119122 [Paraphoma chrysanthemicola]